MASEGLADEIWASIRWSYQDLMAALALRMPEHEGQDSFDLLDEPLDPEDVGMDEERLRDLAEDIRGVLEDLSISRGWDIIEDSLSWHLGFADERIERGEHPNAPHTRR